MTSGDRSAAEEFERLFQAVYLAFHRRDGKRADLPGASRAVLNHLAVAGPLTVGEASLHLDRAQSVMSDIVTQLAAKGLLEREPDPADRRRTLIWLTPAGFDRLARDREVLATDRLGAALAAVPAERAGALLEGMRALLAAAGTVAPAAVPPIDPTTDPVPTSEEIT